MNTSFRWRLRGNFVIGSLCVPTEVGTLSINTVGGSKAEALMRAATIAQRITDDPVMRALLPPQAQAAIFAAKGLSIAARHGPGALKAMWRRMKGPGKKRLAAALVEEAEQAQRESMSGVRYQTSRHGVRWQNRGAWQEWQDPYHDDPDGYDDDAEGYDADDDDGYDDIVLSDLGRRRRKKRKKRSYRDEGGRDPVDEGRDPVDEGQPTYDPPPDDGGAR